MCITIVCINVAYFFHHADQTTHQATMKILKDIFFSRLRSATRKSLSRIMQVDNMLTNIELVKQNHEIQSRLSLGREHAEASVLLSATATGLGLNLIPVYHLIRAHRYLGSLMALMRRLSWLIAFERGVYVLPETDFAMLLGHWTGAQADSPPCIPLSTALHAASISTIAVEYATDAQQESLARRARVAWYRVLRDLAVESGDVSYLVTDPDSEAAQRMEREFMERFRSTRDEFVVFIVACGDSR